MGSDIFFRCGSSRRSGSGSSGSGIRQPENRFSPGSGKANGRTGDTPSAVKAKYRNASILGGNRVVFNVKGNTYRLVVKIKYAYRVVYVRFVGTHAEYDAVNAKEV